MQIDPMQVVMLLLALIIAIPIHEFAHALSAVNNGDEGPRRDGRLSIMPWDHFDPIGAIFCVISAVTGFGLGWGRPVLVNPNALRNPKWGMCRIAAWGPFSNFLLAIVFALPIRFGWLPEGPASQLFSTCLIVNLELMLFNLIPLGPLDGAKIVVAFLPDTQAYSFSKFQAQWGSLILFALIFAGGRVLNYILLPPMLVLAQLLVGAPM